MKNLSIAPTKYTPSINLDANTGIFEIIGKSYPENTFEFYQPMMEWVENYFSSEPQEQTTVNLEIIYFNSSSSKLFFDFFDIFDAKKNKHAICINWIYDAENENAEEAGEDFIEDFTDLKINLVVKDA